MAQYLHLPLFIKTYEFIKLVYRIIRQFRKEYKHTLGAELQTIVWQVLDEIIVANSLPVGDRAQSFDKISWLFDKFKIRFRLAFELGLINANKFSVAQKEIEEIGKMIGGWRKWVGK